MILQSETSLTTDQYNALLATAGESPTYRTTLYKVMPTLAESGTFTALDAYDFGSCVYNGEVWRVDGAGNVARYNGTTWATSTITNVPNRNNQVALSLVTDGTDLYAYACGTDGIYERVYSSGAWAGSWTKVVNSSTVIAMAAVAPDSVYYAEYDSTFHSLFKHWNGATSTFSEIYWPFRITSMAAAVVDGSRNVVMISTPMPGVLKYRYTSNQVIKTITRSMGVVSFLVEGTYWSEHREIDFILESSTTYRYRSALKASVLDGEIFLTTYSRNGTEDHNFDGYRVYSTVDGEHWSRPEFIGLPAGYEIYGLELERLGDKLLALNGGKAYVGDCTLYFNHAAPSTLLDLSNEVLSMALERGDMAQVSLELSGATGWFDPSIISAGGRFWLNVELGAWINGTAAYMPAGMYEVDNIEYVTTLPQVGLKVTGRDFLSWMTDFSEVEDVKNWAPQILGGDKYQDNTNSGFGGMGHTETVKGIYRTLSNTLRLVTNNEEGITFNTFPTDLVSPTELWNFRTSIGFQLAKASNNEYAGICFRGQDKDNLWYAVYQQNIDKLQIIERRAGVNYVRATSASTLSWASVTLTSPRYLMVTQYYARIQVFTSIDNKAWTLNLSYVADGDGGTYIPQTGYCGTIGKGFSDEASWDFDFEWPTIGMPIVEFDLNLIMPGQTPLSEQIQSAVSADADKEFTAFRAWALDARDAVCMIVTSYNPGQQKLTTRNRSSGLAGKGRSGAQDPHNPAVHYALMSTGLYRNLDLYGQAGWTQIATMETIAGASGRELYWMEMPETSPEGYIAVWGLNNLFCYSFDYGATWSRVAIDTFAVSTNFTYAARTSSTNPLPYHLTLGVAFSPYSTVSRSFIVAWPTWMNNGLSATADITDPTYGPAYGINAGKAMFYVSYDWGVTWEVQDSDKSVPDQATTGFSKVSCGIHWPKSTYSSQTGDFPTNVYLAQNAEQYGVSVWAGDIDGDNLPSILPARLDATLVDYGWDSDIYEGNTADWSDFSKVAFVNAPRPEPLTYVFPSSTSASDFKILHIAHADRLFDPGAYGNYLGFVRADSWGQFSLYGSQVLHETLMAGAKPFSHRMKMHRFDENILVWWNCESDQTSSQKGALMLSFDQGVSWSEELQGDFTQMYLSGTDDRSLAFFEFDYTTWFGTSTASGIERRYFNAAQGGTANFLGWQQFTPAMSNGTKSVSVVTSGLSGTITSEGTSERAIDQGLVLYRQSDTIADLPYFLRFGTSTGFALKIWQSNWDTGMSVSKVVPDAEGWYKITKPYVFLQWSTVSPAKIEWFEYRS